jgi:hypothetical protein
LLSTNHASTLTFLLRFLAEVAENSSQNLMDVKNLAIVLAPTMFSTEEGIVRKKSDAGDDMAIKANVIEALIRNAKMVRLFCSGSNVFLEFVVDLNITYSTKGSTRRCSKVRASGASFHCFS